MPTHTFSSRQNTALSKPQRDWRCTRCFKLLGKYEGDRLRLRFGRDYQYDCALPATSVCRCCGTLNELLTVR